MQRHQTFFLNQTLFWGRFAFLYFFLFINSSSFCQEGHPQLQKWKRGQSWSLIAEPVSGTDKGPADPQRYRFSVYVTNPEQVAGADCWRLVIFPGDKMPGDIPCHIAVLVDKKQAWPRKAFPLPVKPKTDFLIQTIGEASLIMNAPDDVPLELFPINVSREYRAGASVIKLVSTRAEKETLTTLTHVVDGQEKLRVRQRWVDGDLWWRYYEKYIDGQLRLRARDFFAPPLADFAAKLPEKPRQGGGPGWSTPLAPPGVKENPLRFDKRLYALVKVKGILSLEEVLEKTRKATGLDIKVSPELQSHQPDLGYFSSGFLAWQLMGLVADKQLVDGRWVKDGEGYRLTAKESTAAAARAKKQADEAKLLAQQDRLAKERADREKFYRQHPLFHDPKLHVKVSIVAKHPSLKEVLDKLCAGTGLQLVLAENLTNHEPGMGDWQMRDAPAFRSMELIQKIQLEDGRWEKTENGYRLTGISLASRPSPGGFPWVRFGLGLLGLVVVGGVIFWWERRRKQTGAAV